MNSHQWFGRLPLGTIPGPAGGCDGRSHSQKRRQTQYIERRKSPLWGKWKDSHETDCLWLSLKWDNCWESGAWCDAIRMWGMKIIEGIPSRSFEMPLLRGMELVWSGPPLPSDALPGRSGKRRESDNRACAPSWYGIRARRGEETWSSGRKRGDGGRRWCESYVFVVDKLSDSPKTSCVLFHPPRTKTNLFACSTELRNRFTSHRT
jgi:hypothetical protein